VSTLRQLNIGSRLGLGFAALIAALLMSGVFSAWKLAAVNDQVNLLLEDRMVKVEQVTQIKDNANLIARSVRTVALLDDPSEVNKELDRIKDTRAKSDVIFEALIPTITSTEGREHLQALIESRKP
jgi:methyl-accepting chemotaxis protein